jgi:Sulfotransferase domain
VSGNTVWVASYPKSGSTWLRAVYTALRREAEPDINDLGAGNIAAERRIFDTGLGVRSSDLTPDEIDLLRPRADEVACEGAGVDVWRKIHDALFSGPSGELVVSVAATRIALYMVRDPRDVAVSLAHQAAKPLTWAVERLGSSGAVSKSARRLDSQLRQRLGTWSEHVASWTDAPPFPVHVVRYEDCLTDALPTFRALFAATGLNPTDTALTEALAGCAWEHLREQEEAAGFREGGTGKSRFFRRGIAGAWVEEMPGELARRIEDQHGEVMVRFGYL